MIRQIRFCPAMILSSSIRLRLCRAVVELPLLALHPRPFEHDQVTDLQGPASRRRTKRLADDASGVVSTYFTVAVPSRHGSVESSSKTLGGVDQLRRSLLISQVKWESCAPGAMRKDSVKRRSPLTLSMAARGCGCSDTWCGSSPKVYSRKLHTPSPSGSARGPEMLSLVAEAVSQ